MPGLPSNQAVKPAAKKKIMSAIVATAKLWSARRHRSDHLVDARRGRLLQTKEACPQNTSYSRLSFHC
jgi:hypothetical protein